MPSLTPLDRRILAAIDRPQRAPVVAREVDEPHEPVREILRGLAHLGYAHRNRGGWWQATERGRDVLR